jgi:3-deoxy-D-manno-octulosonic-acid transferase
MHWIYNFGITLLRFAFFIGKFFNEKAKQRWVKNKAWKHEISPVKVDLWMHCASLGEFDQGLPVLWAYRQQHPKAIILVTFFSPSGLNHYHKRKHCVDFACLLPLDTRKNAEEFLAHFSPKCALFVKYEFWFNFVTETHRKGIPLYSISTLLRKKHFIFSPLGHFFRAKLSLINHFYVQNQETALLLNGIGIHQTTVTGDTRFDHVLANRMSSQEIDPKSMLFRLAALCENQCVMVIGSSWLPEEEMVFNGLTDLPVDKFILAPHDISEDHLFEIEAMYGDSCIRLSELALYDGESVILVDNIGLLHKIYAFGTLAFVGGGFSGNLHNILEPAVYDLPVLFGPNHQKFPEAEDFIRAGIGYFVSNQSEFNERVKMIIETRETLRSKAFSFIEKQAGATKKITKALFNTP